MPFFNTELRSFSHPRPFRRPFLRRRLFRLIFPLTPEIAAGVVYLAGKFRWLASICDRSLSLGSNPCVSPAMKLLRPLAPLPHAVLYVYVHIVSVSLPDHPRKYYRILPGFGFLV